ncbi:MAG: chemotaxis-specific protein-glutamate methyltransferase CheB [Campylobacterota bacterium]|nr:chemotaxis-specific protein-glutamate methyltransferase CheB [Campylobacterota bacterium]
MDDLKTIKVLLVEDTAVQRELITYILEKDSQISIMGSATDGLEAIKILDDKKPDIILMDINMPNLNGYEASKIILKKYAIPIILMSATWRLEDVKKTVKSMELGIVMAINKPPGVADPLFEVAADNLINTVKLVSEIKVVRRNKRDKKEKGSLISKNIFGNGYLNEYKVVVIGSSAGGPPALQKIICGLPPSFPFPVLVVQHMSIGFSETFADWLNSISNLNVSIANNQEKAKGGCVYIAPDNNDMLIDNCGNIKLIPKDKKEFNQPTVTALFDSALKSYQKDTIAIILSGMGKDGVDKMKELKDAGALTIVQDKESSIVFGMPGAAIKNGASVHELNPEKIVELLITIADSTKGVTDG